MYVCMSCLRASEKGLCVCPEPDVKKVEIDYSCSKDREYCYECEVYVCPQDCACEK